MEWQLTMLAVHLAAFVGAGMLYSRAPCWMQKLVMAGLIVTFGAVSAAYGLALAGVWWWFYIKDAGLSVEHLAILVYLFRMIYQGALVHGPDIRRAPATR